MQLIPVDVGNNAIKISLSQTNAADRWSQISVIRKSEPIALKFQLDAEPVFWAVCSVNQSRANEMAAWISKNRPDDVFHLIQESEIELKSNVHSRAQVGRDRLVAALMALRLNDGVGPVAVVDAGTAVTVDLVDANGRFQGGTIFPGAEAVLKTLSSTTDSLPDLSSREKLKLLHEDGNSINGKSTEEAILRGVYHSQIGGIIHIVKSYAAQCAGLFDHSELKNHEGLAVYATGGGIADLQFGLPDSWNFVPDLVLRGAQRIGEQLMALSS